MIRRRNSLRSRKHEAKTQQPATRHVARACGIGQSETSASHRALIWAYTRLFLRIKSAHRPHLYGCSSLASPQFPGPLPVKPAEGGGGNDWGGRVTFSRPSLPSWRQIPGRSASRGPSCTLFAGCTQDDDGALFFPCPSLFRRRRGNAMHAQSAGRLSRRKPKLYGRSQFVPHPFPASLSRRPRGPLWPWL